MLSKNDAFAKCQSLDSQAILPILKADNEWQSFFDDLNAGIFTNFNLQTTTFWLQASDNNNDGQFIYDDGSLVTNVNFLDKANPLSSGTCAKAQLLTTSPPKFSLDAEVCTAKSQFFCVIHPNIVVNGGPTTTTTTTPAPTGLIRLKILL